MAASTWIARVSLAMAVGWLAATSCVGAGQAAPRGAAGPRCPSQDELSELSRSAGTGSDSERRVYAYFGSRFGRPETLSQRGNDAEMTYRTGGGTVRVSIRRDGSTGVVQVVCQDPR